MKHKNINLFSSKPRPEPKRLPMRRERRIGIGEAILDVALLGAAVGILKGSH